MKEYVSKIIDAIDEACSWVLSKKGCRVSVQEKWVDWEKKIYSPAFCCIWYYCAKNDLKFNLPHTDSWTFIFASYLAEKCDVRYHDIEIQFGYLPTACFNFKNKILKVNLEVSQFLSQSTEINFSLDDYSFYRKDNCLLTDVIPYLHSKYPVIWQPKRTFNEKSSANRQILLQRLNEVVTELFSLEESEDSTQFVNLKLRKDYCNDQFPSVPCKKYVAYTEVDGLIAQGDCMSEVIEKVKEKGKMAEAEFNFWD